MDDKAGSVGKSEDDHGSRNGSRNDTNENDINKPLIKKSIGVCGLESCNESFVKTVPNKKYCCEEHKVLAWELRTGKKWHGKKTAAAGG